MNSTSKQKKETKDLNKAFQHFLNDQSYCTYTQFTPAYLETCDIFGDFSVSYNGAEHGYYDIPCSFDIETSSFYDGEEKRAITYAWTFNFFGVSFIGRTWEEFKHLLDDVVQIVGVDLTHRLIIYVHNLSFEFQFMRKLFKWEKVFCMEERKPLFAVAESGIEFRCSYLLSGYSLAKLGEELHTFHILKMTGDLDYKKVRHHKTLLTTKEMRYLINDGKVVTAFIMECIEDETTIAKIPYTKTGYVRRYVKKCCFGTGNKKEKKAQRAKYKNCMKGLTLTPELYDSCKRAFAGGFTHASRFLSLQTLHNVGSHDFTSAYPAELVKEEYPVGSPEYIEFIDRPTFDESLELYCCVFDIEFNGLIEKKNIPDHYISESKCFHKVGVISDNGRIEKAECVRLTITNVDFEIIKYVYNWESFRVSNFWRWRKEYLPKDLIMAVLTLYKMKTELKGVKGKEVEYQVAKGMLNSIYGMMVTDILRNEITYTNEYQKNDVCKDEVIEKYNNSQSRYLYYPWGIFCTAYCRRDLWYAILALKDDYVYSDTDSVKYLNPEKHMDFFKAYNEMNMKKLQAVCEVYNIALDNVMPKTIKGDVKVLGEFDFEGVYDTFKSLGAKRYMTEKDGKIELTISGVNKKKGSRYMSLFQNGEAFNLFDNDMIFEKGISGKSTHTYIDDTQSGYVTDYTGETVEYHELSGVHLEECEYHMGIENYISYVVEYFERIM